MKMKKNKTGKTIKGGTRAKDGLFIRDNRKMTQHALCTCIIDDIINITEHF